jgi:predicted ATPase with chaperone activity
MSDFSLSRRSSLLGKIEPRQEETPAPPPPAPTPQSPAPTASPQATGAEFWELFSEPRTIEETGVPQAFLADLTLKMLYFGGTMRGGDVAQALHLNFSGVVEPLLRAFKAQHLVEVTGGSSLNSASYTYAITAKGGERARELLSRNRYMGPCPISLRHYIAAVEFQSQRHVSVNDDQVRAAMQGLILAEEVIERIGPAVNSHESIFVYGPPGNGKTSIAKAIGRNLLPDTVMVPHAIYDDGQVIKVLDPETHVPIGDGEGDQSIESERLDGRWVRCHPPVVITGGELTLSDLDLIWSDTNRYYEAPLQMKANGGILVIDDFGRQRMAPSDLLNRWIVPLEEDIDYLTFHTGKKFPVPFKTLLVFSTNLAPESLVDEAFLRRISHKLRVDDPTEEQYHDIFVDVCRVFGVAFNEQTFKYLIQRYYVEGHRPLRACHPRDLLKQVVTYANYRGEPLAMTPKLIDLAASSYFEFQ